MSSVHVWSGCGAAAGMVVRGSAASAAFGPAAYALCSSRGGDGTGSTSCAERHAAYGRTGLISIVTTDAGDTSLKGADRITGTYGWDYFLQIKSGQGELYVEAVPI